VKPTYIYNKQAWEWLLAYRINNNGLKQVIFSFSVKCGMFHGGLLLCEGKTLNS